MSAKEKKPAPLFSLARALECGGIFYEVGGCDQPTVLQEVIRRMPVPENVDRRMLLKVLLAREAMASTAIGRGIAIPHPFTLLNGLLRLLGRLPKKKPLIQNLFSSTSQDCDRHSGRPKAYPESRR